MTALTVTRLLGGVDGGGTKTWALVGDDTGRLLGFGAAGPSNYQVVGLELAMDSVVTALRRALEAAGAPQGMAALERAAFYLAGDDTEEDHDCLGQALGRLVPPGVPFQWDNDCWAALRGGTKTGWGAVVIGGSGTNSAAVAPNGRRAILRGMGRDTGNPGGAADIAREAVYLAFRQDEDTVPRTRLHGAVLEALGLEDYDALVRESRRGGLAFALRAMALVTPLVFRLADDGDDAAQEVLVEMGRLMGEQTAAVIARVGLERSEVDVVLAGSVFRGSSPLLVDALTLALHRRCPRAKPHLPVYPPVVGAYLLALEGAGHKVGDATYANVERTLPGLVPVNLDGSVL